MNVFDKNLLFEMSYALMRRFAFIEVDLPVRRGVPRAPRGPGRHRAGAAAPAPLPRPRPGRLPRRRQVRRPPRSRTSPPRSRLLYEVFYAYFLPQFEGIDDERAVELYRTIGAAPRPARAGRGPAHHRRGPRHGPRRSDRSDGREARDGRRLHDRDDPGPAGPPVRPVEGAGARSSGCRRASPASSSAPSWPPPTRPKRCSTPCPGSCGRWPSPPPTEPERCYGELRGPVLWSETMSARSASAGDPGLFVCATTTKAYDTDENRVLKAALDAIRRAGVDAVHGSDTWHDDVARRARHNGNRASHLLEHRTLSGVPVTRVSGRAMTPHACREPAQHLPTRRRGSCGAPPTPSGSASSRPTPTTATRPTRPARGRAGRRPSSRHRGAAPAAPVTRCGAARTAPVVVTATR